ncbi:hypothetical protein D3C72_2399710 [compost metagenome]
MVAMPTASERLTTRQMASNCAHSTLGLKSGSPCTSARILRIIGGMRVPTTA